MILSVGCGVREEVLRNVGHRGVDGMLLRLVVIGDNAAVVIRDSLQHRQLLLLSLLFKVLLLLPDVGGAGFVLGQIGDLEGILFADTRYSQARPEGPLKARV